jgi:predicted acyltransferase (DUF342 family)
MAPGDERGHALLLVLILLLVGSLVIGPLLGFVSTGLTAGPVFEERTLQLYAAGAGMTLAQWHLLHGGLVVASGEMRTLPEFRLNNKDVNVTITRPDADLIFEITSTATNQGGSSTTVTSRVKATFVPPPPRVDHWDHYELSGLVAIDVDVVVHTTVHLQGGSYIEGNLTAGGDVTLKHDSYIEGNVHTGGNVSLDHHSSITGNVIASGHITLDHHSSITGNVHTGGNVTVTDNSSIEGNLIAGGDVSLKQHSYIGGNVTALGAITLEQDSRIEGNVYVCHSLIMLLNSRIQGNVYVSRAGELARIREERAAGRMNITGDIEPWTGVCPPFPTPTAVLTLFWVIL